MWPVIIILGILLVIIIPNVRIVPQATQYVIEFLGKYKTTWDAGIHVKVPFLERIAKRITLKEQVMDSPPQPVITKDNVTMQIDTVVFFRIFDAMLYTYGVVNPIKALENLTATTLRNIVGEMELDGTLTSRDIINTKMAAILDEATDQWGMKVTRVELKNIIPPAEIQNAMEKQMKAERDRRETLLQAEGHKAAAITRAEGDKQAMILAAEGERDARIARAEGEAKAIYLSKKAEADGLIALREAGVDSAVLELKKYEALVQMSNGTAAKLIIPTDAVSAVTNNTIFSETTGLGDTTKEAPKPKKAAKADPCCD
ncbi:MAG: SPFH domain-containing protein [Acutalibacteraceae bacterium]|nr:SPFH/Band 7/PHB domain protein [Clostridia bacterium]MEE0808071.1 SPFH domain-containing protein [Acutalibacteraceae bacterium]